MASIGGRIKTMVGKTVERGMFSGGSIHNALMLSFFQDNFIILWKSAQWMIMLTFELVQSKMFII